MSNLDDLTDAEVNRRIAVALAARDTEIARLKADAEVGRALLLFPPWLASPL